MRTLDIYMGMVSHYQELARRSAGQVRAFYEDCATFWARLGLAEEQTAQQVRVVADREIRCPNCEAMTRRPGYCPACQAEGQDWRTA